jgi:tetratricopeptide (TPR) repeat protein
MRISRVSTSLASAALAAILLPAQTVPPKGGTTTGGTIGGSTGTTGTSTTGTVTSTTPGTTNPGAGTRGAFYFGKVAMSDGTPPPSGVVIQRVCGGSARPEAYTDSSGGFSFQIGQTQDMLPDATSDASASHRADSSGIPYNQQDPQKQAISANGCDLRASLTGYRSDLVSLSNRHNMDDPNLGTIFLHPYSKIEGLTVSATSALAPKEARKAFDKGLEAAKKSKFDEAQEDFQKAAELYPRYASAWLELGRVLEQRDRLTEARDAYAKSIAADSKFVKPYERLYMLSFKELKWDDVAQNTDRIMRLNPYDYPDAVYFNAVANSQLGKLDIAEKSAREAIAMGTAQNPKVLYILGVILAKKHEFKGAAECLKTYLKSDAVTDRDRVKQLLADIEKQVEAKAELKAQP